LCLPARLSRAHEFGFLLVSAPDHPSAWIAVVEPTPPVLRFAAALLGSVVHLVVTFRSATLPLRLDSELDAKAGAADP